MEMQCTVFVALIRRTATLLAFGVSWLGIISGTSALELIEDGSFEFRNVGRPLIQGWDDGAALGNDIGLGQFGYPIIVNGSIEGGILIELPPGAHEPSFTGVVQPQGAGDWFGHRWGVGNGDGFQGSATQIVNVTEHIGRPFEFSAWLASRPFDDPDYAIVTLEFFDQLNANGTPLGSIIFDGNDQTSDFIVGSLNLEGCADPQIAATQDNWTLYSASGTIPVSAQSAAVVIRGATAGTSGGNDGYVDLVSLQVVPEPSSTALAGLFCAIGGVWWMRRKAGAPRA